ncbi:GNAT family N-acetyltransferase [Micrococcus porci]|uniref:GNAT family N-acetyltransferase n=1 Tax=Micrococcus porci TaxID=2856555 RepID=UPI003CEA5FD3
MSDAARRPRPLVTSLRPAAAADHPDAAAVAGMAGALAQAFAEDPYTTSFLPPDRREERLRDYFDLLVRESLDAAARGHGAVDAAVDPRTGEVLGVALWERPGAPRPPAGLLGALRPAVPTAARRWRAFGRHALDHVRTVAACQAVRPPEEHWYLLELGTVPSARGRGAGRALLERRRREARAAGVGIYLESSSAESTRFYEHVGFRPHGTAPVHGADDLTTMWWKD